MDSEELLGAQWCTSTDYEADGKAMATATFRRVTAWNQSGRGQQGSGEPRVLTPNSIEQGLVTKIFDKDRAYNQIEPMD